MDIQVYTYTHIFNSAYLHSSKLSPNKHLAPSSFDPEASEALIASDFSKAAELQVKPSMSGSRSHAVDYYSTYL